MCFKRLSILALAVLMAACDLRTGDQPTNSDKGRLSNATFGCLSGVESRLLEFWAGDLSEKQVRETAGCVRGALKTFETMGRGKYDNGFEAEEISGFLNRKFLGQSKITAEFLVALMRIKLLVVGGSETFVTIAEYHRLLEIVDFIEDEALKNRQFIRIYRMTKENATNDEVAAAKGQLIRTAYSVAEILRGSTINYTIEDLAKLVREFAIFLRARPNGNGKTHEVVWSSWARTYLQVALGQYEGFIAPKDWTALSGTLANWYGLFLDFRYAVQKRSVTYGEGLDGLIRVVLEGFALFETSIKVQKNAILSFAAIDSLTKELSNLDLIPKEIRFEKSIKPTVRYFLTNVFRSLDQPISSKSSQGLSLVNLGEMRKEFLVWSDTQKDLDKRYTRHAGVTKAFENSGCGNGGLDAFRCLMDLIKPFYKDGSDLVWALNGKDSQRLQLKHHFEGLSRLNMMRSFARLLIRGWADDPKRATLMLGVTEAEAGKFYDTIRNIGVDLKLLDFRQFKVGSRFFREGNLFTFSGNGVQLPVTGKEVHLLSLQETVELLALMGSSGTTRQKLYDQVLEACRLDEEAVRRKSGRIGPDERFEFSALDPVSQLPVIPRACVKEKIVGVGVGHLQNLPALVRSMSASPMVTRQRFFENMMEIAKGTCQTDEYVEFGEFGAIAGAAHYSEVLFAQYDKNSDDVISSREAMKSYLKFRVYLRAEAKKRLGKELPESNLKGVFAFLLANGRLPEGVKDEWWYIGRWGVIYFNDDPEQFESDDFKVPDFNVSRNDLLEVLLVLAKSSDTTSSNCLATRPVE